VTVQVIKVDMERRQIDLGLSEILDRVRESEKNRGPRRSRIDTEHRPHGAKAGLPRPPRLPRRSDSFAKAGRSDSFAKAGRSDSVAKAGKRRAQRPGRKERSVKRGKQR
jgi:hypothetical protein